MVPSSFNITRPEESAAERYYRLLQYFVEEDHGSKLDGDEARRITTVKKKYNKNGNVDWMTSLSSSATGR